MKNFAKLSTIALATICCMQASATEITGNRLTALQEIIRNFGSAPVVVNFFPISFDDLKNKSALKAKTDAKSSELLKELGSDALSAGRWSNDAGQIGIYITAAGLEKLKNSKNPISAWPDSDWISKTHIGNFDGSLTNLDNEFKKNKIIEVEITPSVDNLKFSVDSTGRAKISNAANNLQSAIAISTKLLVSPDTTNIEKVKMESNLVKDDLAKNGTITLKLNRQQVINLSQDSSIRSLKKSGYVDAGSTFIDPLAFKTAAEEGNTKFGIHIVQPYASAKISSASRLTQIESQRSIFSEVLATKGIAKQAEHALDNLSIFYVTLTETELKKLTNNPDPRIKAITVNKVLASSNLSRSNQSMHLPTWWSQGYTAAGQNLVILDSGVDKNHPFFLNSPGNSKVILEACYGSTKLEDGYSWSTSCPQPIGNTGDSPLNLAGSGGVMPTNYCPTTYDDCNHGTHVAGIAAGKGTGFSGVAKDANIVSIRTASYETGRTQHFGHFGDDIAAALNMVISQVGSTATFAPYTINMSLGGGFHSSVNSCEGVMFNFAGIIQSLKNMGIPVVASTGNDGSHGAIGWPACVQNVIKIGAVWNDDGGVWPVYDSNSVSHNSFPNQYFFLAPGWDVVSSIALPFQQYQSKNGTSMASPQVAGVYAILKAAFPTTSVDGISAMIEAQAAPVVLNVCPFNGATPNQCADETFGSVKLP